jgi:thymidylate synthase
MKQYLEVLQEILDNGREKESGRPNMPNTIGLSNATIKMNLQDGFPLLTTKKMFWKGIVHELLWFLRGETNIKYLVDNGVNIWNGDAYRWFKQRLWLLPNIDDITMDEFLKRVKEERVEEKFHYKYGDLGPVYGHSWRNFNGSINYYHVGKKPLIDVSNHKTFGFGNKGETKGVKKHPLFQTWCNMISRCYNYNDPNFHKYGGKGVYVSDDWLFFDKFKEDVKTLLNYDLKEKNPDDYQLDKDYLDEKYYSKETCVWLNKNKNSTLYSKNIIYMISNGHETITTDNIEGTAKKLNIEPTNLNRVCNGKRKTAGGWFLVNRINNNKGVDQIREIYEGLKNNPYGRYKILDGWNPLQRKNSALPPCHLLYQFIVRPMTLEERISIGNNIQQWVNECKLNDERGVKTDFELLCDEYNIPKYFLDLNMYQRSCDMFLGVPFNLASMSLLLMIVAKTVGMLPGEAFWIGGDTHIYKDHIDVVKEQLEREPMKLPQMNINKELNSLKDIEKLTINDFELKNYKSHSKLKAELFTGYKK